MASPTIENVGGRETIFGPSAPDQKLGATMSSDGPYTTLEYVFTYDDLPGADSGNAMVAKIPAGAQIKDSTMFVETAWLGGTNITIGSVDLDGSADDPDGLHAAIVTANLTADSIHVGAGSLIGASSGAEDVNVIVVATGTYTAGKSRLVVRYLPAGADV
jgi:hypothetical protein